MVWPAPSTVVMAAGTVSDVVTSPQSAVNVNVVPTVVPVHTVVMDPPGMGAALATPPPVVKAPGTASAVTVIATTARPIRNRDIPNSSEVLAGQAGTPYRDASNSIRRNPPWKGGISHLEGAGRQNARIPARCGHGSREKCDCLALKEKDARACWRSVPGRIGGPRCVEPSRVLVLDRPLKEEVVAPNTGDLQIVRCQPDPDKAVLFQHAL